MHPVIHLEEGRAILNLHKIDTNGARINRFLYNTAVYMKGVSQPAEKTLHQFWLLPFN